MKSLLLLLCIFLSCNAYATTIVVATKATCPACEKFLHDLDIKDIGRCTFKNITLPWYYSMTVPRFTIIVNESTVKTWTGYKNYKTFLLTIRKFCF